MSCYASKANPQNCYLPVSVCEWKGCQVLAENLRQLF